MSRKGIKNGEGAHEGLRDFFLANPDEELGYPEVIAKFGCSVKAAQKAVARLRDSGLIESVHVIRLRARGVMR